MLLHVLKQRLSDFRDDTRGSLMVETVIVVPLLIWALAATYEFFEVHRYKSVREKATYTIGDMISRENDFLTEVYIDNTMALFNGITNDNGTNQIRVSIVKYDKNIDKYKISWSEVRGSGAFVPLVDSDVADKHAELPKIAHGKEVILVESASPYNPRFTVGLASDLTINTRMLTTIRFSPQICFEEECGD